MLRFIMLRKPVICKQGKAGLFFCPLEFPLLNQDSCCGKMVRCLIMEMLLRELSLQGAMNVFYVEIFFNRLKEPLLRCWHRNRNQ